LSIFLIKQWPKKHSGMRTFFPKAAYTTLSYL